MKSAESMTWAERYAFGQSRRNRVRRLDQGLWRPSPARRDAVALLLAANHGRLKDLLPVKWWRMKASPFAFFRGAAPLMASDLAPTRTTGLTVQMCGDAHVQNLGAYAAPDGHLVFDLNDFDESLPGPWEWDLKRLATSLMLAGHQAGGTPRQGAAAVRVCVEAYRLAMDEFSRMKVVELARREVKPHTRDPRIREVFRNAERRTPAATVKKLLYPRGKTLCFHNEPPDLRPASASEKREVLTALAGYRETLGADHQQVLNGYHTVDVAFKLVGTGSVGTRDYVLFLLGNGPDDALFLQMKQALASCYSTYIGGGSDVLHQGRRVAEAQHRLQTVTDGFVGWTSIDGDHFLVRQLADHKAAIKAEDLKSDTLLEYGRLCGEVLAKGHARTGNAAAIAGYCGRAAKLDTAVARFAALYADQTRRDYEAFLKAIRSGAIRPAQS